MWNKLKQSWIKIVILSIIGIVLSVYLGRGQTQGFLVTIINAIFSAGMVLMVVGIAHLLTNLHMFTSLGYGVKVLKNIVTNNHERAEHLKDDYIEYRNSRKHHDDVPVYLVLSGILIAVSALLSLIPRA